MKISKKHLNQLIQETQGETPVSNASEGVIPFELGKQVLMIHRYKEDEHKGYWLAPGGKIEKNEAPHEAAIREYQEETGLTPEKLQMKAVLNFPDFGDSPFGDDWQVFLFHASQYSGELIDECPEGFLKWIPILKLKELPMWEGDKLFTPKVFEPDFFSGKLVYRNNHLEECIFWK